MENEAGFKYYTDNETQVKDIRVGTAIKKGGETGSKWNRNITEPRLQNKTGNKMNTDPYICILLRREPVLMISLAH